MKPQIDFNLIHDLYYVSQKVPSLGSRLFTEVNSLYLEGRAYIKARDQWINFNIAQLEFPWEMAAVRRRDLLN